MSIEIEPKNLFPNVRNRCGFKTYSRSVGIGRNMGWQIHCNRSENTYSRNAGIGGNSLDRHPCSGSRRYIAGTGTAGTGPAVASSVIEAQIVDIEAIETVDATPDPADKLPVDA